MAQRLAKAGEVSYQPLNEITNERKRWFYSMRQKKRKSQGGNRDGQDRREDRPAASIRHTLCAYNQDGRPVMITKHIGGSMGYDRNDRRQHIASCAIVMDSQPASITKTGEAGHWHDLETVGIICELFRHALVNCNAGSESPLFSWQRHHYPRELRDRADTGRDRADMLVIR